MKKIPTLFKREFANHKVVGISDEVTPGMEWVLEGEGEATIKFDGACCAVINGIFYKRFDAKKGRKIPVALAEEVDRLITNGQYISRADFIVTAVRDKLHG